MKNTIHEPHPTYSFIASNDHVPCRIDVYIAKQLSDYSRNFFQGIINQGNVTINGSIIRKTSTLVHSQDTVTVTFPAKKQFETKAIIDKTLGVSIIYETEHFMIIHKPAHLLVHPPSLTSNTITLSDWIKHYHSDITHVGLIDRPGIIHRLDRETSGILIITKTNQAHNSFGKLFRERQITKTYKAIVEGHPEKEGVIEYAIGRDPVNRIKMTHFNPDLIDEYKKIGSIKVRHARTQYKVIEYFENAALLEVTPTTGRTHQIRVHMAAIGHPIIGDGLYGKKSSFIDRHALHAESLSFVFDEKNYTFTDPIPIDFAHLVQLLRTSLRKK